ncbi:MAG: glycosyl transferase [Spirochaetae bacterium HGW-Spirochaetae-1]|jgi:glycosyltransferase involved in cell wall biosynthesis|nr:MAG: glycosyl transferase [Spirochaetae bacterium HGW-Spirochaetae-1]
MSADNIDVVIIGRNEGKRLIACFNSIIGQVNRIIYVDSGSTDGSVENARQIGIEVVELDMAIPFTAARGRNAGLAKLKESKPVPEFVQFIDGDCKIADGWFEAALAGINNHQDVAAVFGRRREEFPDKTPYNRIVDMEWQRLVGESDSCGGDALMRMKALEEVDGYNNSLIAGEEPEMCLRMRRKGWKIVNIGHEMTIHDANITRFEQMWKRSVRCGHAYFDGFLMYGKSKDRYRTHEVVSVLFWALVIPLISIGLIPVSKGLSLLLLFSYLLLWYRLRKWRLKMKNSPAHASRYAAFYTVAKFAELQGMLQNLFKRMTNKKAEIIEYK